MQREAYSRMCVYAYTDTLDLLSGMCFSVHIVRFALRVYSWQHNAHVAGALTGNEGCESVGASPPYRTRPGGVPPRVTTVKVTETHPLMLRVDWNRSGAEIDGMCVLKCTCSVCMCTYFVCVRARVRKHVHTYMHTSLQYT
jgi:hypothetical protein